MFSPLRLLIRKVEMGQIITGMEETRNSNKSLVEKPKGIWAVARQARKGRKYQNRISRNRT
jgi:hypothetical protein